RGVPALLGLEAARQNSTTRCQGSASLGQLPRVSSRCARTGARRPQVLRCSRRATRTAGCPPVPLQETVVLCESFFPCVVQLLWLHSGQAGRARSKALRSTGKSSLNVLRLKLNATGELGKQVIDPTADNDGYISEHQVKKRHHNDHD